jgi:hypothetical protein
MPFEGGERRAGTGLLGQRVLDHAVLGPGGPQLPAQLGDLGDVQTAEIHQDGGIRGAESGRQILEFLFFFSSRHCHRRSP